MPKRRKSAKEPPTKLYQARIQTDPQGSYTGVNEHALEKPVQDADDL